VFAFRFSRFRKLLVVSHTLACSSAANVLCLISSVCGVSPLRGQDVCPRLPRLTLPLLPVPFFGPCERRSAPSFLGITIKFFLRDDSLSSSFFSDSILNYVLSLIFRIGTCFLKSGAPGTENMTTRSFFVLAVPGFFSELFKTEFLLKLAPTRFRRLPLRSPSYRLTFSAVSATWYSPPLLCCFWSFFTI